MELTMQLNLLEKIIIDCIQIGYDKAMEDHNEDTKVEVSKNWAYKKYGRKTVDSWIKYKLIKVLLREGHDRLNRHELYKTHKVYNWHIHMIQMKGKFY